MQPFNYDEDALFISSEGAYKALEPLMTDNVTGFVKRIFKDGEIKGYAGVLRDASSQQSGFITEDQVIL